jgi:hypothetical protein
MSQGQNISPGRRCYQFGCEIGNSGNKGMLTQKYALCIIHSQHMWSIDRHTSTEV